MSTRWSRCVGVRIQCSVTAPWLLTARWQAADQFGWTRSGGAVVTFACSPGLVAVRLLEGQGGRCFLVLSRGGSLEDSSNVCSHVAGACDWKSEGVLVSRVCLVRPSELIVAMCNFCGQFGGCEASGGERNVFLIGTLWRWAPISS